MQTSAISLCVDIEDVFDFADWMGGWWDISIYPKSVPKNMRSYNLDLPQFWNAVSLEPDDHLHWNLWQGACQMYVDIENVFDCKDWMDGWVDMNGWVTVKKRDYFFVIVLFANIFNLRILKTMWLWFAHYGSRDP